VRTLCPAFLLILFVATLPAADSRAIADAAFEELFNQDFAALAKRFSAEMSAAMPSEKLPAAIGPVLKSLGKLLSGRPEPQVTSVNGYDVFLYPAELERAKMTVVITINSEGQVGGLFLRPTQPDAVKPGELAVTSGNIKLPASLVVPEGEGPFPAIVLVHGSGPGDRDETVGANTPFKDLAQGLAKHGVATLRYVKRTRQYPQRGVATVQDEVIEDALSALVLARSQPNIDPRRVFLLGHSLGAYLAPRIATADTKIAGIIMLAGNVRPVLELAREQLQYLHAPEERLQQLKAAAPASYWEDLTAYDPVATARQLEMPILVLQGERDYQVTMKEFELWRSGLQEKEDISFNSYPKLNHIFLEGEGESKPEEYNKPGHIPDYVYADIAAFVNHTQGRSASLDFTRPASETERAAADPSRVKPMGTDKDTTFEVATIKSNKSGLADRRIQIDQQFRARNVTLKELIKFAFGYHDKQIAGGPGWMDTDRYDIAAQTKGEGEPSPEQWRTMIRKLLGERFNLTFHKEEPPMPVYNMVVDESGPKMAKGDPNGPGDPDFSGLGNMQAKAMNMADLASVLTMVVLDRPVLDRTDLAGRYVFSLVWKPDESQFPAYRRVRPSPQTFEGRNDLFTAMREQLGLKLESATAPVEVMVIDQAYHPSEK